MDKVTHFELPTDDTERAKQFYAKVFGWKITKFDDNYSMAYTTEVDEQYMPKEKGAINGGFFKRQADEKPVIVITVPSVDEYITKVKNAGGELVHEKVKVQDMGFYARVKDTEGNVIGIWQDLKPKLAKECGEPGCTRQATTTWGGRPVCQDHYEHYQDLQDRQINSMDDY